MRLFSADSAGNLTGYGQGWDFGAAAEGVSFGRFVTSTGADHFAAQASPSLGAANTGPRVGPAVISQIMYHPPDATGGLDNPRDEFLEIANATPRVLDLFAPGAPAYAWQIQGGVSFLFPAGLSLAAGERLLLVNFDPAAEPAALANFRRLHAVPEGVRILGPYAGKLNNDTDAIELLMPALFPSGAVAAVLVERISYHDTDPWPAAADGLGSALHRRQLLAYGNDPASWVADKPSPGVPYPGGEEVWLGLELAGASVRLAWPGTAAGWTLEQAGELGPGAAWTPCPAAPELVAGQWQAMVPAAAANRYFRLRR